MAALSPNFDPQFFDGGVPAAGYLLHTYATGTTTPLTSYQDEAETIPNTNPIVLDASGRAKLRMVDSAEYRLHLTTPLGATVSGYPIDDVAGVSTALDDAALRADLASTAAGDGPGMIGVGGGSTYAVGTLGWQETQEVHVGAFPGFTGVSGSDITSPLAAAAAFAAGLPTGATIVLPRGAYTASALPALANNVNWRGHGRKASVITFTGTGNGLVYSGAGGINSYATPRIKLSDFGLGCDLSVSNTGAAVLLESCAYIDIENCWFNLFKWQLVLDAVTHFRCHNVEFVAVRDPAATEANNVWIVNGPDRRPGQLRGWTNNLWFGTECQFNNESLSYITAIRDDGGVNHQYNGCNFNAGGRAARIAGVLGLVYKNNAHEGYSSVPLLLDQTSKAGTFVFPCSGYDISSNTFSNASGYEIEINALDTGSISANLFTSYSTGALTCAAGAPIRGLKFSGNAKLLNGGGRNGRRFFGPLFTAAIMQGIDTTSQPAQSYVVAGHAGGAQTFAPVSAELFSAGQYATAVNDDGTNAEVIQITASSGGSLTAVFASSKAANWTIVAQAAEITHGTWMPVVAGSSTPGTHTYTTQVGFWTRNPDKSVHVRGVVVLNVKDAAMAGTVTITGLPATSDGTANNNGVCNIALWGGLTLPANYTQLAGLVLPGTANIGLRRSGSGVALAAVAAAEIASGASLYFEATYYAQ